ncbi:MAG TPA: hypothetical protein VFM12_06875 [Gemmatimonadales bacterium]|jgi:hypothetical protein|nr:hypothetical protein [Gemmatimonadales bacterium]
MVMMLSCALDPAMPKGAGTVELKQLQRKRSKENLKSDRRDRGGTAGWTRGGRPISAAAIPVTAGRLTNHFSFENPLCLNRCVCLAA